MRSDISFPTLPSYDRGAVARAISDLSTLTKGILFAQNPEWHDRVPPSMHGASWSEREEINYGDHALSLFSPRTDDRVRALSFRREDCSIRIQELQFYTHAKDDLPSDAVFKEKGTYPVTHTRIYISHASQGDLVLLMQHDGGLQINAEHFPIVSITRDGEIQVMRNDLSDGKAAPIPEMVRSALAAAHAGLSRTLESGNFQHCSDDWSEWSPNFPEMTKVLGLPSANSQLEALAAYSLPQRSK